LANIEKKYNKKNKLVEFKEFDEKGQLLAHYKSIENKIYKLIYDVVDGQIHPKKSIIEFDSNVYLKLIEFKDYYLIRGESENGSKINTISRVDVDKKSNISNFTIKQELINHWLSL
jgi:hypothetical protein